MKVVRDSSRPPRIGPREMRRLLEAELAKIDEFHRPERQHQCWRVLAEAFGYVIFEDMFARGGPGLPRKYCVSAAAALASVDAESANVFDPEDLEEDGLDISQETDVWFCQRYPGPLAPPDPKAGGVDFADDSGATAHPAARAPRGPIDALQRSVDAYKAELARYQSPAEMRNRWRLRAEGVGYVLFGSVLAPTGNGLTFAHCSHAKKLLSIALPESGFVLGGDVLELLGFQDDLERKCWLYPNYTAQTPLCGQSPVGPNPTVPGNSGPMR